MKYTALEIEKIFSLSDVVVEKMSNIQEVSIDSRTIVSPSKTLFFALPGEISDGHNFIHNAYHVGVRNFVVNQDGFGEKYLEANFYRVDNVLDALQQLAAFHQQSFPNLKKIAITGSNGKTIIKEWLYQMLYDVFHIVKSPKSYNSQIGMALSILGIEPEHELAIFEAGISKKGEMEKHCKMLDPDIGLITNIGSAHDEGFTSRQEKLKEKLSLFKHSKAIVYSNESDFIDDIVTTSYTHLDRLTWGQNGIVDIQVLSDRIVGNKRFISLCYKEEKIEIGLRFLDNASFENCMHCIGIMCFLDLSLSEIKHRVSRISGLHMRMEMTTGMHQSMLINDVYSADLDALQIALEFVKQQAGNRNKLAILSAFDQSGKEEKFVFKKIIDYLINFGFSDLIYISENSFEVLTDHIAVQFYRGKNEFLDNLNSLDIHQKVVLIKGARKYALEEIVQRLSEKGHSATLQINLNALDHNLRFYKKLLNDNIGIIAVVKASAYGSGSAEIARLLARNGVKYFAVAFADEGIALRQSGIETPIMVFNPDLTSLPDIVRYRLEPEVYDLDQLEQIINYTNQNREGIDIHLKLDSGMHRLGFQEEALTELCVLLKDANHIKVKTIFSHLASSEDESDDSYSESQFKKFDEMYGQISTFIEQRPKRHILNSGGISRFPDRQYDFVRLGIGMYGIDNNKEIKSSLRKVHRLSASLIQVKKMKAGDSIGYNRKTILEEDKLIGIVNIGYADGVMRNLGNRKYSFRLDGFEIKILGNVCMDVTIVDLSNVPEAKVGDGVVVFDDEHTIEDLAVAAGTIPYEILSRISTRVKRKFVRE